ncbi:MAG TPA: hypothetical protein VFX16_27960 [Pseudonocardiaceae bacterium]|nr:hypothetical protein [Pseudonocardiaceae bacterium]
MPSLEEAWAWVAGPLENLKNDVVARPGVPWSERGENFKRELSAATSHSVADDLYRWLNELSESDRSNLIGTDDLAAHAYQVVRRAVPPAEPAPTQVVQQQAAVAQYDESAWNRFLTEDGARWDGTVESWAAFRQWFEYYANAGGFQSPATGLLNYLEPMSAPDRVAAFAQYGVTIRPPASTVDPRVQQVMDELLAEKPEYAEIPEARRIELVNALLQR